MLKRCRMAETDGAKVQWKSEWKTDVVYLHVFPRAMAKCVPNISPFAMKLETWLRMNDISYEIIDHMGFSSKKQSPFIMFNEEEMPDSNFIIEYLSKYFKKDTYPGMNPEQKAVGRSFLKMVEENTTWSIFWYRYVEHMTEYRNYLKFQVPEEMQEKVGAGLSSSVKDRAWKHGIGHHSSEEIYKIGSDDIRAISTYLGEKKYFLGDTPSLIDCTLFGFLAQIIFVPLDFPMKTVIQEECSNVLDYINRIKEQFWPHWEDQQL
ncbi:failed axon connections-like isoform X2 [Mizuhopecten yessoensis]|uniref:failed axon connections-like isoform X2 n=1 Tax=Mizuhopecten yessoensis TaxID=6573 RepID=UPI000B45D194|nr:failed axon connections-like isoform X2 [Mizuhopecten yessoensis]